MTAPLDISTARLQLRWLTADDAPFILRLVTGPDWLRFIGDKGVSDLDSARRYIETGPVAMYRRHGFGLNRVARAEDDRAIGICGLLKRDTLADPDLGFALLPEFYGQGYAFEAAEAVLAHARESLGLGRVAAVVQPENRGSVRLLERLGFVRRSEISSRPGSPPVDLYIHDP